jgi:hypothetical protein
LVLSLWFRACVYGYDRNIKTGLGFAFAAVLRLAGHGSPISKSNPFAADRLFRFLQSNSASRIPGGQPVIFKSRRATSAGRTGDFNLKTPTLAGQTAICNPRSPIPARPPGAFRIKNAIRPSQRAIFKIKSITPAGRTRTFKIKNVIPPGQTAIFKIKNAIPAGQADTFNPARFRLAAENQQFTENSQN